MYSKIQIKGKIEVVTGMHIGGTLEFSAIGGVDSPVVRDSRTRLPIIPGSSLKGKLRTLLARELNKNIFTEHKNDDPVIKRLFGSSPKSKEKDKKAKENKNENEKETEKALPSRLIFSDLLLDNREDIINSGAISTTEIKFENTINRATGVANPRQIERVVRGAVFPLNIIYDVIVDNTDEIEKDIETLALGLKLLQYDYIGGNGSRGYGKVKFSNLELEVMFGKIDESVIAKCAEHLKGVELWTT